MKLFCMQIYSVTLAKCAPDQVGILRERCKRFTVYRFIFVRKKHLGNSLDKCYLFKRFPWWMSHYAFQRKIVPCRWKQQVIIQYVTHPQYVSEIRIYSVFPFLCFNSVGETFIQFHRKPRFFCILVIFLDIRRAKILPHTLIMHVASFK